jgi:hypothetical protein
MIVDAVSAIDMATNVVTAAILILSNGKPLGYIIQYTD